MQTIGRKIIADKDEVRLFNSRWPTSTLRGTRAYWFEFDIYGNLVDTDCPEQDDGPAASAMADDCRAYIMDGMKPTWALDS